MPARGPRPAEVPPPASSPAPTGEEPASPRARLLSAALRLFSEQGYTKTSVRAIAAAAQANGAIVRHLIEVFGVTRCMFASNIPVDSLCGSFEAIFGGFGDIVADLSDDEQDALFRRNAIRIYDMGLPA